MAQLQLSPAPRWGPRWARSSEPGTHLQGAAPGLAAVSHGRNRTGSLFPSSPISASNHTRTQGRLSSGTRWSQGKATGSTARCWDRDVTSAAPAAHHRKPQPAACAPNPPPGSRGRPRGKQGASPEPPAPQGAQENPRPAQDPRIQVFPCAPCSVPRFPIPQPTPGRPSTTTVAQPQCCHTACTQPTSVCSVSKFDAPCPDQPPTPHPAAPCSAATRKKLAW